MRGGADELRGPPLSKGKGACGDRYVPATASALDDAAQGVTDVVRGRDLFPATHLHRLLQALLALPVPRYHHHHRLLTDADGHRLAKRHGAPTLASVREAGADPKALVAVLRMGQVPGGYALAVA